MGRLSAVGDQKAAVDRGGPGLHKLQVHQEEQMDVTNNIYGYVLIRVFTLEKYIIFFFTEELMFCFVACRLIIEFMLTISMQ